MQTENDVFSVPPAEDNRQVKNADTNNWDSSCLQGKYWNLAPDEWQAFNRCWRDPSNDETAALAGSPPFLSLEQLKCQRPLHYQPRILVREAYKQTFNVLWSAAFSSGRYGGDGYIITGQPGIGKTMFLWYMLVRLLQQKQVVLFSLDGDILYLFLGDEVYEASMHNYFTENHIPTPKSDDSAFPEPFIWSLFDIMDLRGPKRPLIGSTCFSVQTASPNRERFKQWQKMFGTEVRFMPLWTKTELENGLFLQSQFPLIQVALRTCGTSPDELRKFPGVATFRKPTSGPEPMVLDNATRFLVDQAIDDYGLAARDVYRAIFAPGVLKQYHQSFAIAYHCRDLESLAVALTGVSRSDLADVADYVLAVDADDKGNPRLGFKSRRIGRICLESLVDLEKSKLREMYSFFRRMLDMSSLSEAIFEPFAHSQLCSAAGSSATTWCQYQMDSNATNPPKFSVSPSSAAIGAFFERRHRTIQNVDPTHVVATQDGVYYVPSVGNSPLQDTFTVDFGHGMLPAILWIVRVAVSPLHEGQNMGYQMIRDLMGDVKARLEEEERPPSVLVRYLIVVPQDNEGTIESQFASGWDDDHEVHDHRGSVFCLRIAV